MTRQRTRSDEQRWPAGRRPGVSPGRRFALVLVLAVAALGCWSGVAAADPSQAVNVVVFGNGTLTSETIDLNQLEQQPCPLYTGPTDIEEYGSGGTALPNDGQVNGKAAWTLAQVLGCLPTPVPVGPDTQVAVVEPGGSRESPLSESDLVTPTDFANPREAPLITSDGTGITYDRPARSSTDDNQADQVSDPSGPLTLDVFQGPLIIATATPSANPVTVGTPVTFSVSVQGDPSGPSYSWDFDGGAPNSTQQDPTVTFESAGTYSVTVQITDAQGGVGEPATIPITVTSPSASQTPTGKGPAKGPKHSRGATPGGTAGKHRVKGATGSGKKHGGKQATTGKHTKAATHTTSTAASTGSGSKSGSTGQTQGSGTSTQGSTTAQRHSTSAHHAARRAAKHVKRRSPTPAPAGPLVAGRLISDVRPLPAAESPLVQVVPAVLATAPAIRRPPGPSLLPPLAGGLAILLLLSFGAGRELRWRRPGRHPLRVGS